MRDIKFRAWLKHKNKILQWGSGIISIDHQLNIESVGFGSLYFADDTILMQYIGLKDKNGIEIYEGDILKHPYKSNLVVEWGHLDNGDYETDCYGWIGCQDWENREVIGNIYQNPELIPEVKL